MTTLDISQLHPDPLAQFAAWHEAWAATGSDANAFEPNAMVLATVDTNGQPWARTLLLKHVDVRGFVFFTNRDSNKGMQLAGNARAALHFLWLPTRQVQVQGRVEHTSSAEDDTYFASRPRESQLGAWASQQSRPLGSRTALTEAFTRYDRQYAGVAVPRPPHWGGYRVVPERIEFWQAGEHRLHDRFEYRRDGDRWHIQRLNP
ncbi:MAG: pyridoxamine 5'-phosphate oxidase [Pseudomonadota bacterium]